MKDDTNQPTPLNMMQIGTGFWNSKVLLTAVKFELFTFLVSQKATVTANEIKEIVSSQCADHQIYGFLVREGIWDNACYFNAIDAAIFLEKNKPSFIGGIIEMANDRLFRFWDDLNETLLTGKPQNERSVFDELYSDSTRLKQFIQAMSGIYVENFITFANQFDFSPYQILCDMEGAAGLLSVQVAAYNLHMHCATYDLPLVEPLAIETIVAYGLSDKIKTGTINSFIDKLPKADVITIGMILHDWNFENKKILIKKAYNALPEEHVFIDEERKNNIFGLTISLNRLIEFGDAFDFTGTNFESWAKEAGFKKRYHHASYRHIQGSYYDKIKVNSPKSNCPQQVYSIKANAFLNKCDVYL